MESAAYEILTREGFDRGVQQGMQQGAIADAQEMVLEALETRFGLVPAEVEKAVAGIDSKRRLKSLLREAIRQESLEAFQKVLFAAL